MDKDDKNVFAQMLLEIQDVLYPYAYKLISDRDEAMDLLQETLLKALENRDKYVKNTNLKGWTFTIMRNIFTNNYRREIRSKTILNQIGNLYCLNNPQDYACDTADSSCIINEIYKAIASFPDEYRIPFLMVLDEFKYEQIATALHIPIGTVKSRVFYIRKRLKIMLKDYR